jgi:hypothetical protein
VGAAIAAAWPTACKSAAADKPQAQSPAPLRGAVDIVICAERDEHLYPLIAPLAARLAGTNGPPMFLAVSLPPAGHAARMIARTRPRARLLLRTDAWSGQDANRPAPEAVAVATSSDATQAALELARTFWGRTDRLVIADANDQEAAVLGSALAAHLGIPFIPVHSGRAAEALPDGLRRLEVKEVLLASSQGQEKAGWWKLPQPRAVVLDLRQVQERIIRAIGPREVRNVILARAPGSAAAAPAEPNEAATTRPGASGDGRADGNQPPGGAGEADPPVESQGQDGQAAPDRPDEAAEGQGQARLAPPDDRAAWLAPYVSLVRKAPIVLCHSPEARQAEALVEEAVRAAGLMPRTVTILGDHASVGLLHVKDPNLLGAFEVDVEPCSGAGPGAAAYGVGRLPFAGLADASYLFALGLARQRARPSPSPRVLMVANPRTEYGTLPLAETISRVTAAEFRNLAVAIDEYYGIASDNAAVVKAAESASLIIYQGHVTDQSLIGPPQGTEPVLPEDMDFVEISSSGRVLLDETQRAMEAPAGDGVSIGRDFARVFEPPAGGAEPNAPAAPPSDANGAAAASPREPATTSPAGGEGGARRRAIRLRGWPLVVLQSCHSLDDGVARRAFESGAVGMVGSVTNVYSASGSAFVKAYCDNLLYRRATQAEALRDARNYFLCLAKLKTARGHKEQPKVARAAMSFRLWGDPELQVLPAEAGRRAILPSVTGRFVRPDVLSVSVPSRRLDEARTERYAARFFPAAQAAGIVRKLKDKPQRHLMPTYYFRVPAGEGFASQGYVRLQRVGQAESRAVFLTDPLGRFVHVVYFPEKDKARARFELQFGR